MIDVRGEKINAGDILVQGSGTWGLFAYRVLEDPDTTPLLRGQDIYYQNKKNLSKKSSYYLNLSAMLDRYTDEELESFFTDPEVEDA